MTIDRLESEYKAGTRSLEDFRCDAERLAAGLAALEALPAQHVVGVVSLDTSDLVAALTPPTKQCWREVRRLLPRLAAAQHAQLMQKIDSVRCACSRAQACIRQALLHNNLASSVVCLSGHTQPQHTGAPFWTSQAW